MVLSRAVASVLCRKVDYVPYTGCFLILLTMGWAASYADPVERRTFIDARDPPFYRDLNESEHIQTDLGHAVFNTQWVPAGTSNAARRDGLGPLFNAAACDACHNEGAHGRGPTGEGEAPAALVMELDTAPRISGKDQRGDPRYGQVVNTAAIAGIDPEAVVRIHYRTRIGHYPDGSRWTLRSPQYLLSDLKYGPLSLQTILEPRLAPALFGVGLLEGVPDIPARRFGWQGTAVSIRDQTTKALARDMGLTSSVLPKDDCTAVQLSCRAAPNGGTPEVSDEFLAAVIEFQRYLAVPERSPVPVGLYAMNQVFKNLGCAACHRERLPTMLTDASGSAQLGEIGPYTDLLLHDLGLGLADRTVAGVVVPSRWRTPPLWGLGYRLRTERVPTFLHDGRARSIEEAILWHDGEAHFARQNFAQLSGSRRRQLLLWISTL
jgi:CxxC motif-containing protein (DUF1111 family)